MLDIINCVEILCLVVIVYSKRKKVINHLTELSQANKTYFGSLRTFKARGTFNLHSWQKSLDSVS